MLRNQTRHSLNLILVTLTILIICFSIFAQKRFIQIKGSDTEVNLVQTLAEAYMKSNPGVSLAVTGGGSGTGIAALINKKTDIANSSRPIKADELELAKRQGVEPVSIIFATDAIAVIVNSSNPLTTMTLEQLGQIYRGEIKNWRTLGGPDLPITLYGRQSNSGTFVFFREYVVKADYSPEMRQMNGNSQIVESLRNDKSGIGYVGIGYILKAKNILKDIKTLHISKQAGAPGYSPLDFSTVAAGNYPIVRPLYQLIDKKRVNKEVLDFIKFELSPSGQKIIEAEGFYPLIEDYKAQNEKTFKILNDLKL